MRSLGIELLRVAASSTQVDSSSRRSWRGRSRARCDRSWSGRGAARRRRASSQAPRLWSGATSARPPITLRQVRAIATRPKCSAPVSTCSREKDVEEREVGHLLERIELPLRQTWARVRRPRKMPGVVESLRGPRRLDQPGALGEELPDGARGQVVEEREERVDDQDDRDDVVQRRPRSREREQAAARAVHLAAR